MGYAMKIKHLIYLLTVILFSACVNDDFSSDDKTMSGDDENQTYYICIDLKSPQTPYTREENNDSEEDKFDNFVDGNKKESAVRSVRFYFFDDDGKAVNVRNGSSESQYSYAYEVDNKEVIRDADKENNLEETVEVVLSIQFENGHKPSQVVAILNPNADIDEQIKKILEIKQNRGEAILELSDLQTINTNFLKDNTGNADNADLTSEGNFVMSNSTYLDSGEPAEDQNIKQEVVCAAQIIENNIRTTEEEAKGNPVNVYVERVLAKLKVSFRKLNMIDPPDGEEGNYFLFKLADKSFIPVGEETKAVSEIYVKFLGYALTSTPKKSYLLKNVDENWDHTSFFTPTISWTAPEYSRSYWAINPEMDVDEYQWFSFEDLTKPTNEMKDGCFLFNLNPDKKSVIAYMQENANPKKFDGSKIKLQNPDYHTKAIFAARLVHKNGDPITMAEYESKKYTLDGLKKLVANSLDLWTVKEGEEPSDGNDKTMGSGEKETTYRKIKPEDLDFETATAHGVVDPDPDKPDPNKKEGTYFVYFTLKKKDDQGNEILRNWYHEASLSKDTDESLSVRNIKAYIDSHTFPAKIWEHGMTYYFFDIVHCEDVESKDSPGYFGVVRNTLYSATIDELTSFGTPVYNPAEMIYPENPASEGNQLKVTIESVKWRLVNQDLQLAW